MLTINSFFIYFVRNFFNENYICFKFERLIEEQNNF